MYSLLAREIDKFRKNEIIAKILGNFVESTIDSKSYRYFQKSNLDFHSIISPTIDFFDETVQLSRKIFYAYLRQSEKQQDVLNLCYVTLLRASRLFTLASIATFYRSETYVDVQRVVNIIGITYQVLKVRNSVACVPVGQTTWPLGRKP